ncbi:unnamed protein product [Polarella glacialis]|uniref:RING-type E3 ubiquitin transferase n=2 Tax=Polarella glacialis TaxID=89957 RepID=A0A813KXT7_POLGL|nr:unnamed protein product [Polarella glacialis]
MAAELQPDVYDALWLQSVTGPTHCAGQYKLVRAETANGKPLWKKTTAATTTTTATTTTAGSEKPEEDRWLYANKRGFWCVGGEDAKAKNFDCDTCFLYRKQLPNLDNSVPYTVKGGDWQWWDEGKKKWLDDPSIKVSEVPEASAEERLEAALREVAQLRSLAQRPGQQEDIGLPTRRASGLCLLGVDLTAPVFSDEDGNTLLMLAAGQGWYELSTFLCAARGVALTGGHQAYVDARSSETGWTALLCAARRGNLEIAELLLGSRATPNLASSRGGLTPLMLAADAGRPDFCNALVAARADVAARLRLGDARVALDFASHSYQPTPMPEAIIAGRSAARQILDSALAAQVAAARPPALVSCDWSREARLKRRRRRSVSYTVDDEVRILWRVDAALKEVVVQEVREGDRAYVAGVQPGWGLLSIDGSEAAARDFYLSGSSRLFDLPKPPVTLEFGRPLDFPDDLWHARLAEMVDQKCPKTTATTTIAGNRL